MRNATETDLTDQLPALEREC